MSKIKSEVVVKSASGQRGGRVGADARRGGRGEVGGLGGGRARTVRVAGGGGAGGLGGARNGSLEGGWRWAAERELLVSTRAWR